jgi:hypothetical protein
MQALVSPTDVVTLYVALFNRAPAKSDVDYWYQTAMSNSFDLASLAESMISGAVSYIQANPEACEIYPQYVDFENTFEKVEGLINSIYQTLFNKNITTDKEGVDYWTTKALSDGLGVTIASLINTARSFEDRDDLDEDTKKAVDAFKEKIDLANEIANNVDKFDGDFDKFKEPISKIDGSDESLEEAKEEIKEHFGIDLCNDKDDELIPVNAIENQNTDVIEDSIEDNIEVSIERSIATNAVNNEDDYDELAYHELHHHYHDDDFIDGSF